VHDYHLFYGAQSILWIIGVILLLLCVIVSVGMD
jgi:hypothetical protein